MVETPSAKLTVRLDLMAARSRNASSRMLRILAKLGGYETDFKEGVYYFKSDMRVGIVLQNLVSGPQNEFAAGRRKVIFHAEQAVRQFSLIFLI